MILPTEVNLPLSLFKLKEGVKFSKFYFRKMGINVLLLKNARSILYHLIIQKTDIDDEILIPAYTCESVLSAALRSGRKIRLYDINPESLEADIGSISNNISNRTKIIILQHLFAVPLIKNDIFENLPNDIIVIEDSSQLFNLSNPHERIDYTIFSFDVGKPIPLGYGGGLISHKLNKLIFLNSKKIDFHFLIKIIAKRIASNNLIFPAIDKFFLKRYTPQEINLEMDYSNRLLNNFYDKLLFNYYRFLFDEINRSRIANSIYYDENINHNKFSIKYSLPLLRFPLKSNLDSVPLPLYNLGVRKMYWNLSKYSQQYDQIINSKLLPGAEFLEKHLVTLPTHTKVDDKSKQIIINRLFEYNIIN